MLTVLQNMVVFRVRQSARVRYRNTFQRLEIPGIPQWNPEHPAANSQPIDIPGARFGDHVDVEVGSPPSLCHCSHLAVVERSLQVLLAAPPVGFPPRCHCSHLVVTKRSLHVGAVLAAPPVGSPHCCHCSHLVVMERSLQAMLPATPPVGPQYQYQLRRTKSASF
ncbi:uncharacterized protein LOC133741754 isoform X2 [Rosa rugosa]|uniref:uncharacterized protein LOC133741754 isoform X2 n=1 Tax=Rosa rugosa TaxID=74645 RepID=UPI002B41345E|nr:uncharacterized protein LOC133741754 isoform X2 [Rosa rugosa]